MFELETKKIHFQVETGYFSYWNKFKFVSLDPETFCEIFVLKYFRI